jgi:hypothetical protein
MFCHNTYLYFENLSTKNLQFPRFTNSIFIPRLSCYEKFMRVSESSWCIDSTFNFLTFMLTLLAPEYVIDSYEMVSLFSMYEFLWWKGFVRWLNLLSYYFLKQLLWNIFSHYFLKHQNWNILITTWNHWTQIFSNYCLKLVNLYLIHRTI